MSAQRFVLIFFIATSFVANVNPGAASAGVKEGKKLYGAFCATCHGKSGKPIIAGVPNFRIGAGLMKTNEALYKHIKEGRRSCPSFQGIISDNGITDLITYLRTFF